MSTVILKPFVSSLKWALNPIREKAYGQNAQGQTLVKSIPTEEGLEVIVTPFLGDRSLPALSYKYDVAGVAELLKNTPIDVKKAWSDAIYGLADDIPVLAAPNDQTKDDGIKYEMQLDYWSASFSPQGNSSVAVGFGMYRFGKPKIDTQGRTTAVDYIEIVFVDAIGAEARRKSILELERGVEQAQQTIDSNTSTEEEVLNAKASLRSYQQTLAQINAQYVLPLSDLVDANVQTAVGVLVQLMFTDFKANQTDWADMNVQERMVDFAAAFTRLVGLPAEQE